MFIIVTLFDCDGNSPAICVVVDSTIVSNIFTTVFYFLFCYFLFLFFFAFPGTAENSNFEIDFHVEGKPVALSQKDISYDYTSESGMLHVYIESVHLEDENQESGSGSKALNFVKSSISKIFFGIKK